MKVIDTLCLSLGTALLVGGLLGYSNSRRHQVVKVADGDSLTVLDGSSNVRVRLACIDAPELKQPGGVESKYALQQMVSDRQVQLDIKSTDRYGRKIAEVYVDGVNVNETMLFYGQAYFYEQYKASCKENEAKYREAETYAKRTRSGVWGNPTAIYPWDWRRTR